MESKIHCPRCKLMLRVPSNAAGRVARCPSCQTTFRVPKPDELVEETISTWIEEDVEQMHQEHEQHLRKMATVERSEAEVRQEQLSARTAQTAERLKELFGREPAAAGVAEPRGDASAPAEAAPAPAPVQQTPPSPKPQPKPLPAAPAPSPAPSPLRAGGMTDAPATRYPQEIFATGPAPRLVVVECSQRGVTLAFDAMFLELEGFRYSLPVRCVFSGEKRKHELIARPLAFIDRSQAVLRSPRDIENHHEIRLNDEQPLHDLLNAMGVIEQLPAPFRHIVPYYVSTSHMGMSLECWTKRRRSDEGTTCHVLVPDGHYALEWLQRVNGVCGREYGLLAHDVEVLWSDVWGSLPETVRQRLAAWCAFQPLEQFRTFIQDAEFGRHDEGLGGIVFTDRRLIYHKYHRHGAIDLSHDVKIIIRPDAEFAGVTIVSPDERARAIKLNLSDVPKLVDAAHEAGLQVDAELKR